MKAPNLNFLQQSQGSGLVRMARAITHAGWPTLAGLLAGVCGLLMLAAAWHFHNQANQLLESSQTNPSGSDSGYSSSRQFARATEAVFTVPEESTYIDDLGKLFKLAKAKGVGIGTIEYRYEPSASLPVLVRTLDIRINEDYPKIKDFVAELLGAMPHVSLQEIRVDRKDAVTLQGQILLKLAFVYKKPVANSSVVRSK
jgi:hypothetical protein